MCEGWQIRVPSGRVHTHKMKCRWKMWGFYELRKMKLTMIAHTLNLLQLLEKLWGYKWWKNSVKVDSLMRACLCEKNKCYTQKKKKQSTSFSKSCQERFNSNSQYLRATGAWDWKAGSRHAKHTRCWSRSHTLYIWMISKRPPIKSYKHVFGMRTNTIKSASWVY